MAHLEDVGDRDGWRCWLCDELVDRERSANDDRGPSVDARMTDRKAKAKSKRSAAITRVERLAHRACNTGKGNVDAVVPWDDALFVIDPSPIIPSVDRLATKGGREVMARCPTRSDADATATWLVDRVSRLEPGLDVCADVNEGGGQYLVALRA